MRLEARDVRIADLETCDFGRLPCYRVADLLRAALPNDWVRYLRSAVARRLIGELGVDRRYLTQLPGLPPDPHRLQALDLARSALTRLAARRRPELARLDAMIFVSTSNPNPCNSQAALLAEEFGWKPSCFDLKAGCSGGVLGLIQAALLIQAGCDRVLVVMAENLSQLTPATDLRMLLTVGDGAACVLVERKRGPGFIAMNHGTEPAFARSFSVKTPFPPASADSRYAYEFHQSVEAREFLQARWRSAFAEALTGADLEPSDLAGCFLHQTHGAQIGALVTDLGLPPGLAPIVVRDHGNMGTPTFAVAMARVFGAIKAGQRYLIQAVGGGVSWATIVAHHA
jgi:3-oxoacyl-[acyl-carrier-protein] synthase-3